MTIIETDINLPYYEDAPLVYTPRFKQSKSGSFSFITIFLFSLFTWWIFFDPRFHSSSAIIFSYLISNFGLIGVIWAMWFDNWPYFYKMKKLWKGALIGTLMNFLIILLMFGIFPFFHFIYSNLLGIFTREISFYVSAFVFASLGGSCFSFSLLWNTGTMYYPFLKYKQPKKGTFLLLIGSGITFITWFFFFFFTGNQDAIVVANALQIQYYNSLGWTQWVAFLVFLTITVYKYKPWSKITNIQPFMGLLAFAICFFLGLIIAAFFPYLVPIFFDPYFFLLGQSADIIQRLDGWYKIGVTYPTFLIISVFIIMFFFKSWFEKFKFWNNSFLKTILIFAIGTIGFLVFSTFTPLLIGCCPNVWQSNPIPFLFWFLYLMSIYIYIWKKWPYFKTFK